MSLMSTLGKVALGIVAAKGAGKLMGAGRSQGGGNSGGLLGGLMGGGAGGGLGGLLGGLTGGNQGNQGNMAGGGGSLGGLLNSLGGAGANTQAAPSAAPGGSNNRLGDLFDSALQGQEPEVTPEDELNAQLMLRAMISAAKADGQITSDEQQKITEHLQDATDEEIAFVKQELSAPLDMQQLINDIPQGMEQQAYMMSLLAITLDTKEEAQYLDQFAKGLGLSEQACNEIHNQVGVQSLYS